MPENVSKHGTAVILTALEVEYQAVRVHLRDLREQTYRGTVYEQGTFIAGQLQWSVGLAQIGAGNASAAFEAERAISYFNPQIVLFVGVAGGLKDVKLGDVVAALKVYGYESGKVQHSAFLARPNVGESSYSLVQRANVVSRKGDWVHRIKGRKSHAAEIPRAYIGAIAAGEKVLNSTRSTLSHFLQHNYGDALAVEMEGRGFLQAAHANEQTQALVIRGVSDLIDNKSQVDAHGYQEIAAHNASAFAFEILATLDGGAAQPGEQDVQNKQIHIQDRQVSAPDGAVQTGLKQIAEVMKPAPADSSSNILHIAGRITTPLSLAALVVLVLYLIYKAILSLGNFSSLTANATFLLLNSVVDKVFILALVALVISLFIYALVQVLHHRARIQGAEAKMIKKQTSLEEEKKEQRLELKDIFIHEQGDSSVLDITLYNAGDQAAFLTRARVDVLDVGEFYYCDDTYENSRSFIGSTQNYHVELSPTLKGRGSMVKIAHQLVPKEADRFQLLFHQHLDKPDIAFVWYYLQVTLVPADKEPIPIGPLLLSLPPVHPHSAVWETTGSNPCARKNRETLCKMKALAANRSNSVTTAIQSVLETE